MTLDTGRSRACLIGPILLTVSSLLTPQQVRGETEDCSLSEAVKIVKKMSLFRRMDMGVSFVVLSQANAILQVQSGVDQVLAGDDPFFGPHMRLQKNTDKTQAELAAVKIEAKRARLPDELTVYFSELAEAADEAISLGFRVNALLESGQIDEATRVYSMETQAAWKKAKGNSYTAISLLEDDISHLPVRCR